MNPRTRENRDTGRDGATTGVVMPILDMGRTIDGASRAPWAPDWPDSTLFSVPVANAGPAPVHGLPRRLGADAVWRDETRTLQVLRPSRTPAVPLALDQEAAWTLSTGLVKIT